MRWAFALLALLALPMSSARAYSCIELGCPKWCAPPEYRLGALSSDLEALGAGTTQNEITRAMRDWTLLSCTSLESSYAGRTDAEAITGDGISTIAFTESDWPHDVNAIGFTTIDRVGACIVEADIALNGQSFDWSLQPGSPGIVNAFSVALHEGGHFYGLGHSSVMGSAMYLVYGRGELELRGDDQSGACFLYPGEDPPPDCATTGCPAGMGCFNGVCVDGADVPCLSDTDCGADQRCHLESGDCIPRQDSGEGLGVPCTDDSECATSLCAPVAQGSICSQTCDATDPRSCPNGFHCSGQAVNDCAVGLCLPGSMGTGTFGSACEAHTDCASLHCAGKICSFPCRPGDFVECPGGFACLADVVGSCGACGRPKALGKRCDFSSECASELCLEVRERGVCTQTCNDEALCPDGFVCDVDVDGGMGVCLAKNRGGCTASPSGETGAPIFLVVGLALVVARRRSRA